MGWHENDHAIVSEEIISRLKMKKPVKARVTLELPGGKAFRIVKVET